MTDFEIEKGNTFRVEKGVPMPSGSGISRKTKYPWPDMEVGDCFYFNGDICDPKTVKASADAWGAKREDGGKFRVYKIEDAKVRSKFGDNAYGVWRVE